MGENEKDYDMERDLEDLEDLLRMDDIQCSNCSSSISPDSKKCPVCGFGVKKAGDHDFENRLKATMWAPGIERGIPMGNDLPPPQGSALLSDEETDEPEDEEELEELEEMVSAVSDEQTEPSEEGEQVLQTLSARERSKFTVSIALVLFGMVFYLLTAVFFEVGYLVLSLMVLGTILVLVGGNLTFDAILDRKKRKSISAEELEEGASLKERLLRPGDAAAKTIWTLIIIMGALSYVLLPIYSTDSFVRFIGMGMGSVMIVLGVSFGYNAFFHERPPSEKEEEHVYEAFIETGEELDDEYEWACPVCASPIDEDLDECPNCGTEFED